MTWERFESGFSQNDKTQDLSDRAFRVWVEAIDFSTSKLSDGVVDIRKFLKFTNAAGKKISIRECHSSGLFHDTETHAICSNEFCQEAPVPLDGQFSIHEFLHFQQSREEVQTQRAKDAQRMRDRRRGSRERSGRTSGGSPPAPDRPVPNRSEENASAVPSSGKPSTALEERSFANAIAEIVDLGELEEHLNPDQTHLMRGIAGRNAKFASTIQPSQIERLRSEAGDGAITETLRFIASGEDSEITGIEYPAAYLDALIDAKAAEQNASQESEKSDEKSAKSSSKTRSKTAQEVTAR